MASEKWRERLCLRSSEAVYNQSLVAATTLENGAEKTSQWLAGMVASLAIPPAGGDVDQIKNLASGVCDVTSVNTYCLGRLHNSQIAEEHDIASKVKVFWPNQNDRGAHYNVSGAGIKKHAKNIDEAHKLLAFMVSPEAQRWYADINNEYPVVDGVPNSEVLDSFGAGKRDPISLQILGENNVQALQLMDTAGWR